MTKPSWNNVPDLAEWIAQDGNGNWWAFKSKPNLLDDAWIPTDGIAVRVYADVDYASSLERRPIIIDTDWPDALEAA